MCVIVFLCAQMCAIWSFTSRSSIANSIEQMYWMYEVSTHLWVVKEKNWQKQIFPENHFTSLTFEVTWKVDILISPCILGIENEDDDDDNDNVIEMTACVFASISQNRNILL